MIPISIAAIIAVACLMIGTNLGVVIACLCVAAKGPVAEGGE